MMYKITYVMASEVYLASLSGSPLPASRMSLSSHSPALSPESVTLTF